MSEKDKTTPEAPETNDAPTKADPAPKAEEATKTEEPKANEASTEKEAPEEKVDEPLEITEEVDQAAEEAAKPEETDEVIPEEVKGKAEKVELPNRDIKTGMWVRVHEKIKELNTKGEAKERIQVFEGLVIGVKGGGVSRTMTVRKNSNGWMVEKIFPLSSPNVEKIEVVKQYRTRRAKMSFLRGRFRRKLKEVKLEK